MAGDEIWVLVPVFGMALVFGIAWIVTNYLVQRTRANAQPDESYRALAEEAVEGQQKLLEEMQSIGKSISEVERLLGEV